MPITKQTVAIIGASGTMGSAIAKHVAGGNYRLLLFDKDTGGLLSLQEQVLDRYPDADIEPVDCAHDCSWEADIIILTVPHDQEKKFADKIRDVATQKIVVSMATSDDKDSMVEKEAVNPDDSAAELQQWLPYSKIIKAYTNRVNADLEQQNASGRKINYLIAGDDEKALQAVAELLKTAGPKKILTFGGEALKDGASCSTDDNC